jgi:hypothetical protein
MVAMVVVTVVMVATPDTVAAVGTVVVASADIVGMAMVTTLATRIEVAMAITLGTAFGSTRQSTLDRRLSMFLRRSRITLVHVLLFRRIE